MAGISTKPELVAALQEAAELEHLFMGQYLYAAMSLKKDPDEHCNAAQFEHVRRWAQTLYMIARQEMEHLSIVNSTLTMIGAAPNFVHPGYPTISRFFGAKSIARKHAKAIPPGLEPCEIPFLLEPFSLRTARRYACMESPALANLAGPERADVQRWGFHAPGKGCTAILPPARRGAAPARAAAAGIDQVRVGTIQQMYQQMMLGLRIVEAQLGEKGLFSGHESGQDVVISEYEVYLNPIQDADSAIAAMRLVTQQGEGLDAPPGFDSHFLNFHQIALEYDALRKEDPAFEPARALPTNPSVDGFKLPATRAAAQLFSDGYATLLLMLTGYFGLFQRSNFFDPAATPHLTQALEYNAFSPMMTMFVRTLGEILCQMPVNDPDDGQRAGPVFEIGAADLALLQTAPTPGSFYANPDFYAKRLAALVAGLKTLAAMAGVPPAARERLGFMQQNIGRLAANFTTIKTSGIYPSWMPADIEKAPT